MPDLSIIVVNYHTEKEMADLIRSAEAHPPFPSFEWIIVNNSPGRILPPLPSNARLIEPGENVGFGAGCNLAAEEARGELLFLCNPDITFTQPLDPLLPLLTGKIAGVAPMIQPRQRFQLRRLPTPLTLFVDFCGIVNLWPNNPVSRNYYYDEGDESPFPVLQPAACALLLKRSIFEDLGGFDPAFHPAWFEDVDLAWRLYYAGWRLLCHPGVGIAHRMGVTANAIGRRAFLKIYLKNASLCFKKNTRGIQRLGLLSVLRLGAAMRGIFRW